MFSDNNINHTYSRSTALEDGEQVCLSERFPDLRKLYRHPIYCTGAVWQLIESAVHNPTAGNDWLGVVWEIILFAINSPARKKIKTSTFEFLSSFQELVELPMSTKMKCRFTVFFASMVRQRAIIPLPALPLCFPTKFC